MSHTKIFTSRWYLAHDNYDKTHSVLLEFGSFTTYTRASNFMDEPEPVQDNPRYILMRKKCKFAGIWPVSGKRIAQYPSIYILDHEAQA